MKKIVLLILALFCLKGVPALADEGMWVPALIQSRIKDMKACLLYTSLPFRPGRSLRGKVDL